MSSETKLIKKSKAIHDPPLICPRVKVSSETKLIKKSKAIHDRLSAGLKKILSSETKLIKKSKAIHDIVEKLITERKVVRDQVNQKIESNSRHSIWRAVKP